MKKFFTCILITTTILMNIYLIFYWNPVKIDSNKENITTEVATFSKSIYKINRDKAINDINDENKEELKKIIYKLSSSDIGKIRNYIQDSQDEDKGIVEAFKIIKKRVSLDDYEKIKIICSNFLDFNELEKQI